MFSHVPVTNVTLWKKGLRPLVHSSSLFLGSSAVLLCTESELHAHTHRSTSRRVQDADRHRCIAAFWRRRSCPHPAAQKTQVSSTCTALSLPAAVSSAGRRGQLRIRKRMTPASSSRNFVDGRVRPAPVATPDRRRGLSQTNARRSRPRTGCCPRARSSPSRRRCCRSRSRTARRRPRRSSSRTRASGRSTRASTGASRVLTSLTRPRGSAARRR